MAEAGRRSGLEKIEYLISDGNNLRKPGQMLMCRELTRETKLRP